MGFLGKLGRPAPVTTTDYVEEEHVNPVVDEEKAHTEHEESGDTPSPRHHVHPAAERALVRKLDWHFTPLVAALCRV